MSNLDPETLGFDAHDQSLFRHAVEMGENQMIAQAAGRPELLGEIDRIDVLGVKEIQKRQLDASHAGQNIVRRVINVIKGA